jgi:hypothetical protein
MTWLDKIQIRFTAQQALPATHPYGASFRGCLCVLPFFGVQAPGIAAGQLLKGNIGRKYGEKKLT